MKYYYLLNGKIMWSYEKMPIQHLAKVYADWYLSLKPCDINYLELSKIIIAIKQPFDLSNPIEVTDIVEERKIIIDNSKPNYKSFIFQKTQTSRRNRSG